MGKIKTFFLVLWQLPQYIIGLLILIIVRPVKRQTTLIIHGKQITVTWWQSRPGQFINSYSGGILITAGDTEKHIRHKYGHCCQSRYLGPFFVSIIGFASVILTHIPHRTLHRNWPQARRYQWYYEQWSEAWADRLGGVKRWFHT